MPGPRALTVMLLGRSSWSLKIECREKVIGKKFWKKVVSHIVNLIIRLFFICLKEEGVYVNHGIQRYCIKVFDDVWLCIVCFILFSLDVCKCSFLMSCSSCRFDHNCSQLQFSVHVNC